MYIIAYRGYLMDNLEDILFIYMLHYRYNNNEFINYLEIENVHPFLIEETKVIISTLV